MRGLMRRGCGVSKGIGSQEEEEVRLDGVWLENLFDMSAMHSLTVTGLALYSIFLLRSSLSNQVSPRGELFTTSTSILTSSSLGAMSITTGKGKTTINDE